MTDFKVYILACPEGHREIATSPKLGPFGEWCARCDNRLRVERSATVRMGRRHSEMPCYRKHDMKLV